MSLLRRDYLGLSLHADQLQGVALQRQGKGAALLGARGFGLKPEVLQVGLRGPNVTLPKDLIEALVEVLSPLAGREDRVALSLPDACGRVIVTELEAEFKTKKEGVEILRWQLKKNLPSAMEDIRLDFQVLTRTDTGRRRVVASLMDRSVLEQYEEVVAQAGFHAALIDFHSFNLFNYYRPRLDMGDDFVFIGVEGKALILEIFQNQALLFHRVREVGTDPQRVFQELNRSLVGFQASQPTLRRSAVYLHSDWEERDALKEVLASLFDKAPVLLDPHLERMTPDAVSLKGARNMMLVSAVGAAERMIWGAR